MNKKVLQILDITTTSVDNDLYNTTANNRKRDPYWVEFIQPYFNDIDVDIRILPLQHIDFSKTWLINVDINMWNWDSYNEDIFSKFDPIVHQELKSGNAYIILNHQCESWTNLFFNILYRKKISVPYEKIIYMVAAADVEREYNDFVLSNNIPINKRIRVMFVHHVYKRLKHDVDLQSFNYSKVQKTKKFISLNRRWREHRVMLVSLLAQKNLIDQGYVSLGVMPNEVHEARRMLQNSQMQEGFNKLEDKLPLQVDDVDLSINQFRMNSLPINFYQNSCFSIVSSTMALLAQEPSAGFTEKEVKPILAKHPFIIWNRPGALQHLKTMGFLTFEPWFDESYDKEINDLLRLEKIVKLVEQLCGYSFTQWETILQQMEPVLDHNYNRMVNYTNEHCFFNSDLKKLLYYVS